MSAPKPVVGGFDPPHASMRAYVSGFVLSIVLTLTAYVLVSHHLFSYWPLVVAIAVLAFVQFIVQLLCFLHLGNEFKPRWRLLVFCFMIMVVLILVIGSLWIMNNLNYRMTPTQINNYMNNQDGL